MRVIIADNLQNTGYYDWTVPNRPGSNYKIVVIARDAAGNFGEDESDGTFEIVGASSYSHTPSRNKAHIHRRPQDMGWS
jgi:hypothetical protein